MPETLRYPQPKHYTIGKPKHIIVPPINFSLNQPFNITMAKLLAILTATAALLASVQAQGCPANAKLCGHELIDDYQCEAPRMDISHHNCPRSLTLSLKQALGIVTSSSSHPRAITLQTVSSQLTAQGSLLPRVWLAALKADASQTVFLLSVASEHVGSLGVGVVSRAPRVGRNGIFNLGVQCNWSGWWDLVRCS